MGKVEKPNQYAVLTVGAKQRLVRPGDLISVEKLAQEAGSKVDFNEVLLVRNGDSVSVGQPFVSGATVKASVVSTERGPKLTILHKRRRKHSKKKIGHRQDYSILKIESIKGA